MPTTLTHPLALASDDFFTDTASLVIADALELVRAVRDEQAKRRILPAHLRVIPTPLLIRQILTSLGNYNEFLTRVGAAPYKAKQEYAEAGVQKTREVEIAALLKSRRVAAARRQIEEFYWCLPVDTQKSVMGCIWNTLRRFEGLLADWPEAAHDPLVLARANRTKTARAR